MKTTELLKNLEVIIASPNGLANIQSLILDLAFSGALLEGEIGKPELWQELTLEKACDYIQRGKSPSYASLGKCLVVSQKSVHWSGFKPEYARYIEDATIKKYSADRFLKLGDLLWNSTGTGTVGRTTIFIPEEDTIDYVADSHVTVLRSSLIESRFLHYWTRSPKVQNKVLGLTTGSTNQQELNLSTIKSLVISFPSKSHQILLANHIEGLMGLCEELNTLIKKTTILTSLVRKSAVDAVSTAKTSKELQNAWERIQNNWDVIAGTPESISSLRQLLIDLAIHGQLFGRNEIGNHSYPVDWSVSDFKSICDIEGGSQPSKSVFVSEPREGYVQLFQIRDLGNNPIPVYIPTSLARSTSIEGEVLVGRYGASVGKIFKAKSGAYNVALVKFIFPKEKLNSDFIYWFLKSSRSQSLFTGMSRSAQAGFNKRDLGPLLIPIPARGEQERIVERLNSLMGICDELEQTLIGHSALAEKFAQSVVAAST